jgi:hypothetical protein
MRRPITSEADAQSFFKELQREGKLFHPEDSPETVVDRHGNALFNSAEVNLLRQRIDEVYAVMADPCNYILTMDETND